MLDVEIGISPALAYRPGRVSFPLEPLGMNRPGLDAADHSQAAPQSSLESRAPGGESRQPRGVDVLAALGPARFVVERRPLPVVAAEGPQIAAVVGGEPLPNQVERVVASVQTAPPAITFTTTRLRRCPSNSA